MSHRPLRLVRFLVHEDLSAVQFRGGICFRSSTARFGRPLFCLALPDRRVFTVHDLFDLETGQVESEDVSHTPNKRPGGKGGIPRAAESATSRFPSSGLYAGRAWPAAPHHEHLAE